jgi:hypothetical protein
MQHVRQAHQHFLDAWLSDRFGQKLSASSLLNEKDIASSIPGRSPRPPSRAASAMESPSTPHPLGGAVVTKGAPLALATHCRNGLIDSWGASEGLGGRP